MDNAFVRRMFAILVTIVVMTAFMLFHPLQISAQTQDYSDFSPFLELKVLLYKSVVGFLLKMGETIVNCG
jgi:hypothetical protein